MSAEMSDISKANPNPLLQTSERTSELRQEVANPVTADQSGDPPAEPDFRKTVYRFVFSIPVQTTIFVLVLIDVIFMILEISFVKNRHEEQEFELYFTLVVLIIMFFECLVRMYAVGEKNFVKDPLSMADLLATTIGLVLVVLEVTGKTNDPSEFATLGTYFIKILRITRIILRIPRVAVKGRQWLVSFQKAVRIKVRQNKKGLNKDGFDLDLTLVGAQDRMYAMSVPAKNLLVAAYRNPYLEVARFFNTTHGNAYRIYNCCPELPYPHAPFNDNVRITPPSMKNLVEFCLDADKWLKADPRHVIAVHCKGGKGRTGSMCVAYMLYSREFARTEDALHAFATRRTDMYLKGELQGVETPSQVRYLYNFNTHLLQSNCYATPDTATSDDVDVKPKVLREPPARPLALRQLRFEGFFAEALGKDNKKPAIAQKRKRGGGIPVAGDICVTISNPDTKGGKRAHTSSAGSSATAAKVASSTASQQDGNQEYAEAMERAEASEGAEFQADKQPGRLMGFWFHTFFVNDSTGLLIQHSEMDKACKNATLYNPSGKCTLITGPV
ncbi:hypothetical protein CYMTET_19410 [Cymbomonas tetramitiformis]|uniref:Phosphatidylinositol-3,4,5-trisphosphate 3-phosphatase n=1 Tax=Cymbomonas tetramitiformis TaxID=36881 RepID=A0AAE0L4Z7_9CHLO|nr:hypothetical protein CYMTET_19410 [Cymbomonas tetramitiformis]